MFAVARAYKEKEDGCHLGGVRNITKDKHAEEIISTTGK